MKLANALLEIHLRELGLSFVREYKFHPERKWRFDYVLSPKGKQTGLNVCAVEIEGGLYVNGGHSRGKAYELNLEKYNAAVAMNWTLFRFSTGQVLRGEAKQFLAEWLEKEKPDERSKPSKNLKSAREERQGGAEVGHDSAHAGD